MTKEFFERVYGIVLPDIDYAIVTEKYEWVEHHFLFFRWKEEERVVRRRVVRMEATSVSIETDEVSGWKYARAYYRSVPGEVEYGVSFILCGQADHKFGRETPKGNWVCTSCGMTTFGTEYCQVCMADSVFYPEGGGFVMTGERYLTV